MENKISHILHYIITVVAKHNSLLSRMAFHVKYSYCIVLFLSLPTASLSINATVSDVSDSEPLAPGAQKIPLPIGALFTSLGAESSDRLMIEILNIVVNAINNVDGILDDYHLYMRYHYDKVGQAFFC